MRRYVNESRSLCCKLHEPCDSASVINIDVQRETNLASPSLCELVAAQVPIGDKFPIPSRRKPDSLFLRNRTCLTPVILGSIRCQTEGECVDRMVVGIEQSHGDVHPVRLRRCYVLLPRRNDLSPQ